jgi:hypothetical protein
MARIVYNLESGIAMNIRFVKPAYVLQPGERETTGGELPTQESLSSPSAFKKRQQDKRAAQDSVRNRASVDDIVAVLKKKGLLTDQDLKGKS